MDLHSGPPFWPVRDGLLYSYPALDRDVTTDVVILGAGITGALLAYELSRAGVSVVVLDRRDVATGSTAATSGLLLYDTDASLAEMARSVGPAGALRAYRVGVEAIDRIEALTDALGDRCGFARRPALYLASHRRHVARLERECETRRRHGFDVEWLAHGDLETRFSIKAPAGILSRGAGEIDCYRLAHRLLAAAASAGARIFDRTAVASWQSVPQGMIVRSAAGHVVQASRLVCATGYEIAAKLRRRTGLLATTWAFVSEPIEGIEAGWTERCLIWETARPYLYVRSTDDGRVLVGGEDEPGAEEHRRGRLGTKKIARLLERAQGLLPRLQIDVAYAWAGTIATTDDGLPFIGAVPEYPHVWFALGYGGNGITFSVAAADILREAYFERVHPDAALFSFDRRTGNRRVGVPAAW